jgi:hypothetical protein
MLNGSAAREILMLKICQKKKIRPLEIKTAVLPTNQKNPFDFAGKKIE